jgi:predicted phosphoadenosine phosphosulfate sulfurtransferase
VPQVIIIASIADYQQEVHLTIVRSNLFHPGQSVGIAASGGKDSTVLAHVMTKLNAERGYGLRLCLLSIDEGITGYRDDSLETVKRNADQYALQLTVLSYQQLYRTPPLTTKLNLIITRHAAQVWVEHGRHRPRNRPQKQLHILRRVQTAGARPRGAAVERGHHLYRPQCRRYR